MIQAAYLRIGAAVALGAGCFIAGTQHEHRTHVIREAAMQAAFDKTITDVRAKTAAAQVADLAHARAVEAAQEQKRKDAASAYETDLADARRDLAVYAQRLRAASQANSGDSGAASVPGTPQPTGSALGTSDATVMDDLEACAVNTVKAEAWRDWWLSIR